MPQHQTIKALPEHIICRIAAGEVVERPAGALKELIENSIDAGATQIDIHIENGGKSFLKIIDNGAGIAKNDLPLALSRHATSKLQVDEHGEYDLTQIDHLGFRGEALAAISSVSVLSIQSYTSDQAHGYSITSSAGSVEEIKPCALSEGTIITIKDLFYAVPARLSFLKSDRSEQIAISDVIKRQALMYPHIGFSLKDGQKKILNYLPSQQDLFHARFTRIGDIISKEFIENAMPIDHTKENIKIEGLCSIPTYHRGNGLQQFLYVNGRAIRDKMLHGILRAAYSEHLARDRHPICVLFITVPNNDIDVNVHPTKAEVRFKNEQLIRGAMITAIRTAISEIGHQASNHTTKMAINALSDNKDVHQEPQISQIDHIKEEKNSQISALKPSIMPLQSIGMGKKSYPIPQKKLSFEAQKPQQNLYSTPHDTTTDSVLLVSSSGTTQDKIDHVEKNDLPPLGYAQAQLHLTYIVSQTENGMIIVDQHAAHERIILEKVKDGMKKGGLTPQSLLIPEIIDVSENEFLHLNEHLQALQKLGLTIEPFGMQQILVRTIPTFFTGGNIKGLVKDLCDDLCDHRNADTLLERINLICATFACHHSIRAGRKLSTSEMNALLREMEKTEGSGQCNHGRPTYITLEKNDIEKLFGRK